MYILRGVSALLMITVNTVLWCMPLYLMGLVRVLCRGRPRQALGRHMDSVVQLWVAGNNMIFTALRVTRIHQRWDDDLGLSRRQWYLVLSNHQSWADILVLQNTLRGRIPIVKFFTKRQLIWVPLAGLAMWFLGFPYVRRLSREKIAAEPRLAELDRVATINACARFRRHPTAVLSFLEGSRFTPAKRAAQAARFEHLLNPKLGGVSYVVDALRDRIHKVLDITIAYPTGVPSFWALLQGRCRDVEVLIQCRDLPGTVTAARDVAEVRDRLQPWIESLWQAKDAHLRGLQGLAN
jgi:1-acyl-sn-glycerol-3-phosphate acyltransferase